MTCPCFYNVDPVFNICAYVNYENRTIPKKKPFNVNLQAPVDLSSEVFNRLGKFVLYRRYMSL